jgi:hypothetical protein
MLDKRKADLAAGPMKQLFWNATSATRSSRSSGGWGAEVSGFLPDRAPR